MDHGWPIYTIRLMGRSEGVAMTAASPEHAQTENCSCKRGSGNNYTSMHDIEY